MRENQITVAAEQENNLPVSMEALSGIIAEVMKPVMQAIGEALKSNSAALSQLAAAQTIQNDRLEALEKQMRLQTPISSKQVTYLNEAIRGRARELLDKRGIEDDKAATKLGSAIRKTILIRYGIGNMREIPKHEYMVAMTQINMWNDALTVRDVTKEARERAGQAAGMDDQNENARPMDQSS